MIDKTKVFNLDCLIGMKSTPDKFYELAIVDVPYGIGRDGSVRTTSKHGGRKAHAFKGWDDMTPDDSYFSELFRVSKNQIVWGANYMTQFLPPSMGWIFWDKGQRICNSDGELAYSSFDRALRVVTYNRVELQLEAGETIHPTQKPIKLYKWLLKNYAKEGDKILDTHGGSMSSVIACLDMGFPITCFELDTDYYNAGKNRIINHLKQLNAFRPSYDIEFHDNSGVSALRDQHGVGYQEQKNGENNKPIHRIDGLFHGDAA